MTLPAFMEPKKEEYVSYHNWLYSVVPATQTISNGYKVIPYLAGYCKNCRRAFTVALPTSDIPGDYLEMQLDIPREGCILPQ